MAVLIAVVGAESTGKTTLARDLVQRLEIDTGLRVALVPEGLRDWCARQGRTPRQDEQDAVAQAQGAAIDAACRSHDIVVADTTPLMTAIYSQYVFGDASLLPQAVAWQRRCAITLVTALDLPWVADGLMRDGPHVQVPVMQLVRHALLAHALPWALVQGSGSSRVESAMDAVSPLLRSLPAPRRGLFTRLSNRNAEAAARAWSCERCDDPDCEHRVR